MGGSTTAWLRPLHVLKACAAVQMFSDVHDCALEYLYSVLSFDEGDVIDRKQLEDGLKHIGVPSAMNHQ